ncbi:MAG: RNA polymerase sigma factor [Ruminococcus sp.]|nr:RNA polymerase sigma factor [Ruminococcus sp.]
MKSEFEKYIGRYSADLTRLCVSLCGNFSDAEDLFQDTWLKALRHYKKYDESKPFDKWLYSICVNTYKNSMKSAFVKKRMLFNSDEEERAFFERISQADDNREDYEQLHKAVSSLSKKHRIVIVLYYFKDYSISEIAQIINVPTGTVKSRLSVARAQIKRRLLNEQEDR